MTARAVMVLGTSSHAGKSLLTAALYRIFARQGHRVALFKSQNMSLNSAATPEGLEIGRAQALQAEAAGIAPSVHMNPILLKPAGDMTSQVIVHGQDLGPAFRR
jgi:adenosylcobyric acid synthase